MSWNYFGSGHGKGEVDGAGALLKWEIRNEQLKPNGRKLQDGAEIVQFLRDQSRRAHARPANARCQAQIFFWLIPKSGPGSVDRVDHRQADRVLGNMSRHQCRSISS
jgi:hypothetical protein